MSGARPAPPKAFSEQGEGKHLLTEDVDWFLGTLDEHEQAYYSSDDFLQNCQELFARFDKDKNGFLSQEELQHAVVKMFPTQQRESLDEGTGHTLFCPRHVPIKDIVGAFDTNADGRISKNEFPPFVRFCQAWRVHAYFTLPQADTSAGRGSSKTKKNKQKHAAAPKRSSTSAVSPSGGQKPRGGAGGGQGAAPERSRTNYLDPAKSALERQEEANLKSLRAMFDEAGVVLFEAFPMMDAKGLVELLRECKLMDESDPDEGLTKAYVKQQVEAALENTRPKQVAMKFEPDFLAVVQKLADRLLMPVDELIEELLWRKSRWSVPQHLEDAAKEVFDVVTIDTQGLLRLHGFTKLLRIVAEEDKLGGGGESGRKPFEISPADTDRIFSLVGGCTAATGRTGGTAALNFAEFKQVILEVSYLVEFHPRYIYLALQNDAALMERRATMIQARARGMLDRKKLSEKRRVGAAG